MVRSQSRSVLCSGHSDRSRPANRPADGLALRSPEVHLHLCSTLAEFRRGLWSVRNLGQSYVLGIQIGAVLPTALLTGLLSEALKYIYIFALPWLNFGEVYGPFAISVSLMFWAFRSEPSCQPPC